MDIQHGGQDHTVARCFEPGYFTFYDSPIEEIAEVTSNLRILVFIRHVEYKSSSLLLLFLSSK